MSAQTSMPKRPAAELHLHVEQIDGFEFRVRFDHPSLREMVVDEPPPLGRFAGPNAARLLGAAIANCLCASFLFATRKRGVAVGPLDAEVRVDVARDPERRLRIPRITVDVAPTVADAGDVLQDCIREFQELCLVTQSVRDGIDVVVNVTPIVEGAEGPTS